MANDKTMYIAYGRSKEELPNGRVVSKGVHGKFPTEEEAVAFVMGHLLAGFPVHCVIVRCPNRKSDDRANEVVWRVGDGRAWWE